MTTDYQPGDILSRRKGIVMHRGLVLDDDRVLHNTPFKGEHVSTVREFQKNRRLYVHAMGESECGDAFDEFGQDSPRRYNLFTNNCEHTISRTTTGRGRSPQLASFLISGGVAAATLVLTRSWGLAAAGFALTRKLTTKKNPL